MKFVGRVFGLLCVAGLFSAYNFSAMAYTDCNQAHRGKYCKTKNNHKYCPNGCYCPGNTDAGKKAVGDMTVTTYCKNKETYASVEENLKEYGIFFCPKDFPHTDKVDMYHMTEGAYKDEHCYVLTSAGAQLYRKEATCAAGKYLPKNKQSACTKCEKGYYCWGGNYLPSIKNDIGKIKCPDGYTTSGKGAKKVQDCVSETNNSPHPGVFNCTAGTYFNAEHQQCESCPTDAPYFCPGVNGVNAGEMEDRGIGLCNRASEVSDDRTKCIRITHEVQNNAISVSATESQQLQHSEFYTDLVSSEEDASGGGEDNQTTITCNAVYVCDNGMGQTRVVNNIPGGSFELLLPDSFCNTPSDKIFGGWVIDNVPVTEDTYNCIDSNSVLMFTARWNSVNPDNPDDPDNPNYPDNPDDPDNPNNTNTTGTLIPVAAGYYIPAGGTQAVSCVNNSNISMTQFCPGGNWLTGQSTPQGVFNCLPNGVANSDHKSCNVVLNTIDLTDGIVDDGYCWLLDDTDEYIYCVLGGATDAAQ